MLSAISPLVSVCIPAYNHEQYIGECLDALLSQHYPNMELIVINDGSKDKTWDVLNSYKKHCEAHFKRVVFKTQENQGTCRTLNSLFQEVKGDYIALCASDDKFLPNAIDAEATFLTKNPQYGLVIGQNLIMDSESRLCYWDENCNNVYAKEQAIYTSFSEYIEKVTRIMPTNKKFGTYYGILSCNHIVNGWMFRRELLEKIPPFTPDAPLEDFWFMLQVSKWAKIATLPQNTFCYRWHASNTIKQVEKMNLFLKKTYNWEKAYIKTLPTKKFYFLFMKVHYTKKIKSLVLRCIAFLRLTKVYNWVRHKNG